MRHFFKVWITIIFCTTILYSQKPLENRHLEMIPDEHVESFREQNMRISVESNAPVALYHVNFRASGATPEEMARNYLRQSSDLLKIRDDLSDLRHTRTMETPGGHHVRFWQYEQGFPVYNAEIVVNLNRENTVTFVMNSYRSYLKLADATPRISVETAYETALNYLDIKGRIYFEKQETIVYYNKGETRLAHKIVFVPSDDLFGDWEVLVDAHSGEIFRVQDKAFYGNESKQRVDGSGWVFDPDPLTHARASYQAGGQFGDNNDADTDSLTVHTVQRTLLDITFDGSDYHLDGPYASIVDSESPNNGTFSQSSDEWHNSRNAAAFEAANVYYHIDQSMRYINETLGFTLMPFQYSGGVRGDPHGLGGQDNSHYIGSTGELAWGEGGVDDAEDADVIIHELGHGLHDWLTNGSLSQVNGLSEGSSDYWANSYNRSKGFWTPSDAAYYWTFQWDGHNEYWNGRITNYSATYPGGLIGQIHTDGQIWATALMAIWDDIGRAATDANFLEALSMTNSSTNQEDAAQAFVQADVNLHGGANLAAIQQRFNERGYNVTIPLPDADIDVSPASINASVDEGSTTNATLTIANTAAAGSQNIAWTMTQQDGALLKFSDGTSIPVKVNRPSWQPEYRFTLEKGAPDPRRGQPVLEGTGGPDAFGYTWIDSDEASGPTFNWQDISTVGTELTMFDDWHVEVTLPFTFPFYGNDKTSIFVVSNGLLGFLEAEIDEYQHTSMQNGNEPNELISPFWTDLNPTLGDGAVYHYHNTATDEFIVQYQDVQPYGGGDTYTFQVILTADGVILFQYLDMQDAVDDASVGIENNDGSVGLQVVMNNSYIQNNLAVRIEATGGFCNWLTPGTTNGSIAPGGSENVNLAFDASSLMPGTYNCVLSIASNDPDENPVNVPVQLTVNSTSTVTLLGTLNDHPATGYSDCWGWTAPDGREYALLGVNNGTSVIDITDPANPVEISFIPGATSDWRDIKTYQHYAYTVNETGGGMDIIDLSNLPTSATLVTSFTGFTDMHNLFIDTTNAILYASEGSGSNPCQAYSLADPVNPALLSTFGIHNHDSWSTNNLVYLSEGGNGSIGIFDLSTPGSPSEVTRFFIPAAGYVHNAWGTPDGNYLMTTEETSGKTIKMWDLSDLNNVTLLDEILGPSNLAHNAHIKGDYAYVSHYADGLIIYDISDPANLSVAGSYDTHAATSGFSGAWGAFPFFPSGNIIISDQSTGLYIVSFSGAGGSIPPDIATSTASFSLSLDPDAMMDTTLKIYNTAIAGADSLNWSIIDETEMDCPWVSESPTSGKIAPTDSQSVTVSIDATGLSAGNYTCNLVISSDDPDESSVTIPINLTINVPGNLSLSGTVLYAMAGGGGDPSKPIAGLTADVSQNGSSVQSALTDASGDFSVGDIPPNQDYRLAVFRDSGAPASTITPTDALLTFNHFLGSATLGGAQQLAADVDSSLTVEPTDALNIFNRFLGMSSQFSVDDWRTWPATYDVEASASAWANAPDGLDYINLGSSLTSQDFYAVLKGDVNFNWAPTSPALLAKTRQNPDIAFKIIAPDVTVEPEVLNWQIFIDGDGLNNGVHAFGLDIRFDHTLLEITDVQWGNIIPQQYQIGHHILQQPVYHDAPAGDDLAGLIRTGGFTTNAAPIQQSGILLDISARLKKEASVGTSIDIRLENVSAAIGSIQGLAKSGSGQSAPATFNDLTLPGENAAIKIVELPKTYELGNNYPNPFNPSTRIEYQLPENAQVRLAIYNTLGEKIRTLVNSEHQPAGYYAAEWQGKDQNGQSVASGIYFYRFEAIGEKSQFLRTQKMMLLK